MFSFVSAAGKLSSVASVKLALSATAGGALSSVVTDCSAISEVEAPSCVSVLAHRCVDRKIELRGAERRVEAVMKEEYARDGEMKADGREERRREAQSRRADLGNCQCFFFIFSQRMNAAHILKVRM